MASEIRRLAPRPSRRTVATGVAAVGAMLVGGGAVWANGDFADGHRLTAFLDGLQVESRWPAGVHVDWETGLPDGKTEHFEGKHTHCSAFVASAAKQLGVYILRPPEHAQTLLANAQFDWLAGEGAAQGWTAVADGYQAQRAANRGFLVVAAYKNHDPDEPGHIAILRPTGRDRDSILAEGPEIIMAGVHNYQATTVQHGFANHPTAFADNEIRYYQHSVAWPS
jgi:hypothetical protein